MGSPKPRKRVPASPGVRAAAPEPRRDDDFTRHAAPKTLALPVRPDTHRPVRPIGVRAEVRIGRKSI